MTSTTGIDAEHKSQLDALKKRIHIYATTDTERFLRRDLEAQLNFVELQSQFEFLRAFCQRLETFDLAPLPSSILAEGVTALDRIDQLAQPLAQFSVVKATEQGRPVTDARNAVANAFREKFPGLLKQLTTLLAFGQFFTKEASIEQRLLSVSGLESQLGETVANAQAISERLKELERTAKDAAQKAGITRHAVFFHEEADAHEANAKDWLRRTALLAAGVVVLAGANLYLALSEPPLESTAAATYLIFAKLLVFTTVVSAALWCARVYRAHKHNAVVNRHRQHALSSFESFAASAEPDVRSAVLLQATQSIFAPQHSGFGTTDADPAVSSPIVELVRAATAPQK